MTLYLKYRPNNFKTMVGQDHVVTTLQNALTRKAVAHAYLFEGTRGTGKTSLARIFAKAINCQDPKEGDPCNRCSICADINTGRLVDLIEIDAASNRGIDEIRDLREKIQFAPTHAKAKVYIIDEVHMLTKEAFNALLKTLEEPPEHAYFILATTEPHKIPETIVSRCQQFIFKRINPDAIKKQLEMIAKEEGIGADAEALSLIAKMSGGSLRDAIGLLEQMNLNGKVETAAVAENLGLSGALLVESFFQALKDKEALKALEIVAQLNNQGKNLQQFLGEVIGFLREQILISLDDPGILAFLLELTDLFSKAKSDIHLALIPQLPVEMAIVKVCRLWGGGGERAGAPIPGVAVKSSSTPFRGSGTGSREEKQKNVEKKATETDEELNLTMIKVKWPLVIGAVKTPFIRVSLLDGEAVAFEKGELHLRFKSGSYMEKVMNQANQAEIQEAFLSVFQKKIKLKTELQKINLKPVPSAGEKKAPSLVEMAKEVFSN